MDAKYHHDLRQLNQNKDVIFPVTKRYTKPNQNTNNPKHSSYKLTDFSSFELNDTFINDDRPLSTTYKQDTTLSNYKPVPDHHL